MTEAIQLYVLNADGTQKFDDHGHTIYTDEAKAAYVFGADGKPEEDGDGNLILKPVVETPPVESAETPAVEVEAPKEPVDLTLSGAASSTEQAPIESVAAAEGTGEVPKEPEPAATAVGGEAALAVTGTPSVEVVTEPLTPADPEPVPEPAASLAPVAAAETAPAAVAPLVLAAKDSVATDAEGVLHEIITFAEFHGGDLMHEIRNLAGKAKAFITGEKAAVVADVESDASKL